MNKFIEKIQRALSNRLVKKYDWLDSIIIHVETVDFGKFTKALRYGFVINDIKADIIEQSEIQNYMGDFHTNMVTGMAYNIYAILPDGTTTSIPFYIDFFPSLKHLKEGVDKKEKYYQFIVDSLMRDTSLVDYPNANSKIKTPVRYEGDGDYYYINKPFSQDIDYLFNFSTNFRPDLRELLFNMYGINAEESEMLNIRYKQSLREKYLNNG